MGDRLVHHGILNARCVVVILVLMDIALVQWDLWLIRYRLIHMEKVVNTPTYRFIYLSSQVVESNSIRFTPPWPDVSKPSWVLSIASSCSEAHILNISVTKHGLRVIIINKTWASPLILLKPISSHLNLIRKLHLLIELLHLVPPFDINTALLDHYRHPSKLDDIALSNDVSVLNYFLFLSLVRSFLEFTNSVRLTAEDVGFSAEILKLLRDKFIGPLDLLSEIELQILVLINAIIWFILEDW